MTVGQQASRLLIVVVVGSIALVLAAAYIGLLCGVAWWAFTSMLEAIG